MSMKEITNEVIDKFNELKKLIVKQMCDADMVMNMDPEALKALQLSLGSIDDATRLMEEYANILDEQNKKLDMILAKLDKKG